MSIAFACGASEPRAVEPARAERCEHLRLPMVLRFRCLSSCIDPELIPEHELDALVVALRDRPGLRRIVVRGYVSSTEARHRHGLDARRAESVAARLIDAGFERAVLETEARGVYPGALDEPDLCPSPIDDRGHPHRRVELSIVECEPDTEPSRPR